jgi:hypothetical protein
MASKREQPSWTVTKMADEGTSSPFMARLFLNILDLRKSTLQSKAELDAFDKPYELVLMSSITVEDLAREINELIADHRSNVEGGIGVRIEGRSVHVDEPIDKELRRLVESFLNSSNRVMLTGMKEAAKALGLDITFFFKKESTFTNGVTALDGSDPNLAAYCRKARIWADMLNSVRNDMEHNFWSLPRVQYKIEQGRVVMIEPEIMGRPVSNFTNFVKDRILCFVEEICAHGLQGRMPKTISVTEIPVQKRAIERAERYVRLEAECLCGRSITTRPPSMKNSRARIRRDQAAIEFTAKGGPKRAAKLACRWRITDYRARSFWTLLNGPPI